MHVSVSAIWSPTFIVGFSELIGSWKIMPMRLPRTSWPSTILRSQDVDAAKQRRAARDAARRHRDQAHDALHGHRLAAARLADDRERLAGARR